MQLSELFHPHIFSEALCYPQILMRFLLGIFISCPDLGLFISDVDAHKALGDALTRGRPAHDLQASLSQALPKPQVDSSL